MNSKLKEIIEIIFSEYSPLQNIDKQLIQKNHEYSFRKLVDEKIFELNSEMKKRILAELFSWGPLESLIHEPDIFDIIIQGEKTIFYENSKGMHQHQDEFLSPRTFKNFTDRLIRESGLLINQRDPFGNGQVYDFCVHMIIPPIAKSTSITLRKHKKMIRSMDYYLESGFLSTNQLSILLELIDSQKNFLIIGPTGSGKTTFLNSLLNELDLKQRIVIVEDTDEIQSDLPLVSKLLTREVCPESLKKISMEDLVKQALRMRPDRIIIGEVRGQEAKDLLQALATGHSGSMGTLHAQTAKQALIRLEMLIQMGAPQWSLHSIRQLIQMSLQYLVVLKEDRINKGIKEICKISSHEKFGLLLENILNNDRQSFKSLSLNH